MNLSEYCVVEEVNDVRMANKYLEEGWVILETRVEEWIETEKQVPFKRSLFCFLMGKRQ